MNQVLKLTYLSILASLLLTSTACRPRGQNLSMEPTDQSGDLSIPMSQLSASEVQIAPSTSIRYSLSGGMPRYDENGLKSSERVDLKLATSASGAVVAELILNDCTDRFLNVSSEHYLNLEGLVRRAKLEGVCPIGQTCVTIDAAIQFVEISDGDKTQTLNFTYGNVRVALNSQQAIIEYVDKILSDLLQNSQCRL